MEEITKIAIAFDHARLEVHMLPSEIKDLKGAINRQSSLIEVVDRNQFHPELIVRSISVQPRKVNYLEHVN